MRAKITYQDATNRIKFECGGYRSLMRAMECLLAMAKNDELQTALQEEEAEIEAEERMKSLEGIG